jgi:hypothetical protein
MSAPMISWVPINEFMAMQAMEEAYARYGEALHAHDIVGFARVLTPDYRCVRFDGTVANLTETLEDVAALFDSACGAIVFHARLVAVSDHESIMRARAAKELQLGETAYVEDVEEIWRLEDGEWLLAETRICGG